MLKVYPKVKFKRIRGDTGNIKNGSFIAAQNNDGILNMIISNTWLLDSVTNEWSEFLFKGQEWMLLAE